MGLVFFLLLAGSAVSFDASKDQGLPLYLCLSPEHQSVTVRACGVSAEGVSGKMAFMFPLG